jgi:trimethylamine--corrinoid protein Co-methyltransferase
MSRFNVKPLSHKDLEKIHEESLRILHEVGAKFPNQEVLEVFRKNGASVDFDDSIVKMPSNLVEEVIRKQVENNDKYYSRYQPYEEHHQIKMWMSMGNLPHFIDPITYKRRKGTLKDLLQAIVVGNELENLEKISCFGIPAEYEDEEFVNILRYYLLVLFSKKRWFLTALEPLRAARCMIEMAQVIAENDMQLRNGSLMYFELEPVQNLEYSKEHLDILVELSRHQMNVLTTHWGWMGYHTPMTYASLMALANANILAGLAAIISLNPENLYFNYLFPMHIVNKKYPQWPLFGAPNQVVVSLVARQLADFYGFKFTLTNCFFSDSIEDNFQLGFERGVTAALSVFSGIDLVGVQGILGADAGISLEQLVIDNEMLDYINFILRQKIEINNDMFDFESIQKAGPGSNFYQDPKNAERWKDVYWDSDIFVAEPYENWKKHQAIDNVRHKIKNIVHNNFPPEVVISQDQLQRVDEIMDSYVRDKKMLDSFRKSLAAITRTGK